MSNGLQPGSGKSLKNCSVILKTKADSGYSGNDSDIYTVLRMSNGDASWQMTQAAQYELSRGKLDDVKYGDEAPMEVTIEGKYTYALSNADNGSEPYTPLEIVTGMDFSSGNTSAYLFAGTRESWLAEWSCVPYCFEIEIHDCPLFECPLSTFPGEAYLFRYARVEQPNAKFSDGKMSINAKCHVVRPLVRRVTAADFRVAYGGLGDGVQPVERNVAPLTGWAVDARAGD